MIDRDPRARVRPAKTNRFSTSKDWCVGMAIYTVAEYQVRPSGIEKAKQAIEEFVRYVRANEPGTQMYIAWQKKQDLTRFLHFFIFENEAAHTAHSKSDAVKRFESAYRPELVGGDVVFTDYLMVASNQK